MDKNIQKCCGKFEAEKVIRKKKKNRKICKSCDR